MKLILVLLFSLLPFDEAVQVLSGASEKEELDASVMERFYDYEQHPLRINECSRSRMLSSGLLTSFQVASFLDWRGRHGDVLSLSELSTIDGFPERVVSALGRFISLESAAPVGKRHKDSLTVGWYSLVGTSIRKDQDEGKAVPAFRVKQRLCVGERLEMRWQSRTTYSERKFGFGTGNLAWNGGAGTGNVSLGKVVVGDFAARFGQGLAMWTGYSMSGFSGLGGFVKNPSGISASSSFSESAHGVAADINIGSFVVSAGVGRVVGLWRGLANVTYVGRALMVGGTAVVGFDGSLVASADFKLGFKGGAMFGEAAMEKKAGAGSAGVVGAGLLGLLFIPGYGQRLSAVLRFYPATFSGVTSSGPRSSTKTSDEHGVSVGWEGWGFGANLDCAWHPSKRTEHYKAQALWKKDLAWGNGWSISPDLRVGARLRPQEASPLRLDSRAAATLAWHSLRLGFRFDLAKSLKTTAPAWLWYAEAGYVNEGLLSAWLRAGLFRIDEWQDRIYVYERDAPGNFSTLAYYGRGWNASAVASLRLGRRVRHSLNFRCSIVRYPWTFLTGGGQKPGRMEAKLQYVLTLD